jgi:L-threonylcarbamoyladenylate synthase
MAMATLSVSEAAQRIAAGQLVAFPTETVYGLGADADQEAAVAQIFTTKGRPADHPLIVHVLDADAAQSYAAQWPQFAQRLVRAFWPGPLTVILPRREGVASACAAGQDSIGLRCPSHPVARQLLAASAALGVRGIAAPSANRFGKVSPTRADHVRAELGVDFPVLEGGACEVGIESTIIDCTRGVPVLLRPGVLTVAQIEAAMGQALRVDSVSTASHNGADSTPQPLPPMAPAPRASGTLESHYAPQAPLRLMDAKALQTALDLLGSDAKNIAVFARTPLKSHSSQLLLRRMPDDAAAAAQQLFAVLRDFDAHSVRLIWVESVPDTPEWDGVRDRLRRAAA